MTLRGRVLAGIAAIAVFLVLAAVLVTSGTERHLIDQVDAQLRAVNARDLFGGGGPGGPHPPDRGRPSFSELYVAVVRPDGVVAAFQEPDFAGAGTPLPVVDAEHVLAVDEGRPFTLGSEAAGFRYRAMTHRTLRDGVSIVALPLADTDAAVRRLVAVEVGVTLAALAVLALVAWWVVRLGVRPIKQMTETASAIAAGDLSHRVPDVAPGTEAGELGVALNQMLGRIETAFDERTRADERLRRFVADASHELRTPVTTIRGYAELYRAGGLADDGELSEAMRRTEQEAVRMGSLVDDLLQLARLDQGRPLERHPVDLRAVVDDAARDARATDPAREVRVAPGSGEGPVVVEGDEARLRQVVANVVGNALVHTPSAAAIELGAGVDGGTAWLEVTDRGQGMAPDVAVRAFERFYRADPSRSRHRGGTGLGLSIVEATVAAHGGRVTLASTPGEGTIVRIELPSAGAATPA
ncbi:MAG: HAMP domain-containing protein [Acidimicrobiia bacterium]|nr:HAMP domain-containing protein [Acidimicrobiia bacterium]